MKRRRKWKRKDLIAVASDTEDENIVIVID